MANELQSDGFVGGVISVHARREDGFFYDTALGNYAAEPSAVNVCLDLAEVGATGFFKANAPAGMLNNALNQTISLRFFRQTAASFAYGDDANYAGMLLVDGVGAAVGLGKIGLIEVMRGSDTAPDNAGIAQLLLDVAEVADDSNSAIESGQVGLDATAILALATTTDGLAAQIYELSYIGLKAAIVPVSGAFSGVVVFGMQIIDAAAANADADAAPAIVLELVEGAAVSFAVVQPVAVVGTGAYEFSLTGLSAGLVDDSYYRVTVTFLLGGEPRRFVHTIRIGNEAGADTYNIPKSIVIQS